MNPDEKALADLAGADPSQSDPMTAAEFRVVTEWLGLRQRDVAAIFGVNERTVRSWLAGRYLIPEGVREQVEQIEAATGAAVGELVSALQDSRDPAVLAYRTDEEMWAARPEIMPYPAGWWRMVIARAVSEVPGVVIDYAARRDLREN